MERTTLNEILEMVHPLSEIGDLSVVGDILNIHRPKNIIELGVGNGDWLLFAAAVLQDNSVNFMGYENFTWTLDNGDWASNVETLNKINKERLSKINLTNNMEIKNNDIETLSSCISEFNCSTYDIVRLDCLCNTVTQIENVIDAIMPYTSDNCIFLVDDILPSYCPNRFLSFMEKVEKGELKPLWFGEKEGAWVKPSFDVEGFSDKLAMHFNQYWYTGEITWRTFYEKNYQLVATRPANRGYFR
jgi:hypothetical protein